MEMTIDHFIIYYFSNYLYIKDNFFLFISACKRCFGYGRNKVPIIDEIFLKHEMVA